MAFFAYCDMPIWFLFLLSMCIQGLAEGALRGIILTASGGAFRQVYSHMCYMYFWKLLIHIHLISIDHDRDWPVDKLKEVKVADALKDPNWNIYGEEDHSRFSYFIQQGILDFPKKSKSTKVLFTSTKH
jgi:hypothetical protein